ncbi:MAG: hypothetical protein ABL962_04745 [Fimbriimonadaceae bacterium]
MSSASWTLAQLHPTGATKSYAFGAGSGKQYGYAIFGGIYHAVMWSGSANSWVDLHPTGAASSVVRGASASLQVGASSLISGNPHACLWSGTAGSYVDLNPIGAAESRAYGTAGNVQVGSATLNNLTGAALWTGTPGSFVNLNPAGSVYSVAYSASSSRQVGFAMFEGAPERAGFWMGSAGSWVSLHPSNAFDSSAYGCSETAQVGKVTYAGEPPNAALWFGTSSSVINLNPPGYSRSEAFGALDSFQVGYAAVLYDYHAGIWSGSAASFVDLHSLLPPEFDASQATSISSDGIYYYVTGVAYNEPQYDYHAVVWKRPVEDFDLLLNKTSVAGQNSVLGSIELDHALSYNATFATYDNSSLVTTPPNVTVLAGQTSRNFQITTTAITSTVTATIFAARNTVTRSKQLTLTPLIPTAIQFTPSQVAGGQATSCKVVINGVAGPGGRVIAIFDNSPYATVPGTVTVPAGSTNVSFAIETATVPSLKYVTVTARVSAGEKSGTFRITP